MLLTYYLASRFYRLLQRIIFFLKTESKVVKSLGFGVRLPVHNLSFVTLYL